MISKTENRVSVIQQHLNPVISSARSQNVLLTQSSTKAQQDQYLLIQNGTVVNHDYMKKQDVLIKNEKIHAIGEGLKPPNNQTRVIDATGRYVCPGGIDSHVHFELKFGDSTSADDFATGTKAAVAGGTTTIIDFALDQGSILDNYRRYRKTADPKVMCDYALHVGVTHWDEQVHKEMGILTKEHGVNSFKFFMAYKGLFMVTDEELLQAMVRAKEIGAIVQVHAEHADCICFKSQELIETCKITGPEGHILSRPSYVEGEATNRACVLAKEAGNVPLYIVHVMSAEAKTAINLARARGQRVIGETVIAALTLDSSVYWHKDWDIAASAVMSPPIRSKRNQQFLIEGLKKGELDLIGTDHCSFPLSMKRKGLHDFRAIPNGVPSVQNRLELFWSKFVYTGLFTPMDFVRLNSSKCAQVFNIYPQKGRIAIGSDADICIIDPNSSYIIKHDENQYHNVDYSIFEGWKVNCKIEYTICRGRVLLDNGKLNVSKGYGKFIPTPSHGYMYEGYERQCKADAPIPAKRS